MNLLISGSASFARYPNLALKKYQTNAVAATTAIIEYEKECQQVIRLLDAIPDKPSKLITTARDGVEQVAESWGYANQISVKRLKPMWAKNGKIDKRAGYDKILEAVTLANSALIVGNKPDSHCRTIIQEMKRQGKPVLVVDLLNRG